MLRVQLNETREKLGKLLSDMRALGTEITGLKEKGQPFAEQDEKFSKMLDDMEATSKEVERLERAVEVETQASRIVNAVPVGAASEAARPGAAAGAGTERQSATTKHREIQQAFFRYGSQHMAYHGAYEGLADLAPQERHALMSLIDAQGGFLVTEDFRAQVIQNLAGFAVVRQSGASVFQTDSQVVVFPSITAGTDPWPSGFSGQWRQEGDVGTDGSVPTLQDQPQFGQERVPVHDWFPPPVVITPNLLEDSKVNVEQIIAREIAQTKALDEDYHFLRGNGVGSPRGILDYTLGSTVNSGAAGDFTYNGLIDLMQALPAQYRDRAVFYCRSAAFGNILKLKDSSQMPILYASQVPGTLFGKKVFMSEHMPAVSGSNKPLLFGDPSYYYIVERTDLRVQRLIERFAPNVGFYATARLGGALVRTQAFVVQNISA